MVVVVVKCPAPGMQGRKPVMEGCNREGVEGWWQVGAIVDHGNGMGMCGGVGRQHASWGGCRESHGGVAWGRNRQVVAGGGNVAQVVTNKRSNAQTNLW